MWISWTSSLKQRSSLSSLLEGKDSFLSDIFKCVLLHLRLHRLLDCGEFAVQECMDVPSDRALGAGVLMEMEEALAIDALDCTVDIIECDLAKRSCDLDSARTSCDLDEPSLRELPKYSANDDRIRVYASSKEIACDLALTLEVLDAG